jgi:hypothetical protein
MKITIPTYHESTIKFLRDLADEIEKDPKMLRGIQTNMSYEIQDPSFLPRPQLIAGSFDLSADIRVMVKTQRVEKLVSDVNRI